VRPTDKALDPGRDPPVGAHLLTPRRAYTHHGIYVGEGRVVQYGGLSRGLRGGPVEEVSLSQFARGREIWVRSEKTGHFGREDVIHRARLRLGEDRYHPLKNNCEHFCEWCVCGHPRSYQVEEFLSHCSAVWRRIVRPLFRMIYRASEVCGRQSPSEVFLWRMLDSSITLHPAAGRRPRRGSAPQMSARTQVRYDSEAAFVVSGPCGPQRSARQPPTSCSVVLPAGQARPAGSF